MPSDENARVAALAGCAILDTDPEPEFDELVQLAARACGAPVALVTLVDQHRQWFKARIGLRFLETPRDIAFCAHTILGSGLLVVEDTTRDERFVDNPLVATEPRIRFYAGAPLTVDAQRVGSLCVIDFAPRALSDEQRGTLATLARDVSAHLELRSLRLRERERERQLELARARAAASEEAARLAIVTEQMPIAIWTTDRELRFTSCVGAAVRQLTLDRCREEGLTLERYLADAPAGFPALPAHRRALGGESVSYEADWRGMAFLCHVQPLRDADGAVSGVVGVALDVTAQHRLQAQFLQAQKMESVGRLAGGIAHDFNNLLTVILGYAELGLRQLAPEHPVRLKLQGMARAAQSAAALTRQLLAFSRKQVLRPHVIALGDAVQGLEPMLRRLIGDDIALETAVDPAAPPVVADPTQIEQVLMNLAVNARDAMPRGGRLSIRVSPATAPPPEAEPPRENDGRTWSVLRVQDTGSGMDDSVRAHAFEPFFTTKEAGRGSGLGLATVYGVVAQTGGAIAIDSTPGKGTAFSIWLPPAEGAAAGERIETSATPAARGAGHVLLVEDDDTVRELIAEALQSAGFRVSTARDGLQALDLADTIPAIDLVVTDIVMPGMSGIDLVHALASEGRAPRAIYVSGYSEAAIARYGVLPEGAFLAKPFALDDLVALARAQLADAQAPG